MIELAGKLAKWRAARLCRSPTARGNGRLRRYELVAIETAVHARCFTAEAVQHDALLSKAIAGEGARHKAETQGPSTRTPLASSGVLAQDDRMSACSE